MRRWLIMLLATGLAMSGASAAWANEVKVGGSLQLETSYSYYNSTYTGSKNLVSQDLFNSSLTRLNLTYRSDDKKFTGFVELGYLTRSQSWLIYTRHAYMTYNFGGGSILIGQTDPLANPFYPRQMLNDWGRLMGYGYGYWLRTEQIRLSLGEQYKFLFALEAPKKTQSAVWGPVVDYNGLYGYVNDPRLGLPIVDPKTGQTYVVNLGRGNYRYIPALSTAFNVSLGSVTVYPWLRYERVSQYYSDPLNTATIRQVGYNSLDVGLQTVGEFGWVGFTAGVHWGLNSSLADPNGLSGQAGYSQGSNFYALAADLPGYPVYDPFTGHRIDHKQVTAFGELRFAGFAVGGGYQMAYREGSLQGAGVWKRNPWTMGAYANYLVTWKRIELIPEIVWYNQGKDQNGLDRGDVIKVGLFTRLNF